MNRSGIWAILGAVLLAVVVVLAILGWQLNWWLKQSSVNHNNHITRSSYSFQVSDISAMDQDLVSISSLQTQQKEQPQNSTVLGAQIGELNADFCNNYFALNAIQVPSNIKQYASEVCTTP